MPEQALPRECVPSQGEFDFDFASLFDRRPQPETAVPTCERDCVQLFPAGLGGSGVTAAAALPPLSSFLPHNPVSGPYESAHGAVSSWLVRIPLTRGMRLCCPLLPHSL